MAGDQSPNTGESSCCVQEDRPCMLIRYCTEGPTHWHSTGAKLGHRGPGLLLRCAIPVSAEQSETFYVCLPHSPTLIGVTSQQ